MEGSVQNLLTAENEAKEIVNEAKKQRKRLTENANARAQQEINMKMKVWEQKLQQEAADVSKSS